MASMNLLTGIRVITIMLNFSFIKEKFVEHKKMFENFFFLSLTQIFNLVYPFITYPYLIKTLGPSVFGLTVFAQTLCSYFSMIIIWGFDTTATKEIAIHRHDRRKLSEIVCSIFILRFILWCLCFSSLYIIFIFFDSISEYKNLYLFTFLLTLNELLIPLWYFRGIEKMKYITFLTIFIRCVFLAMILIFIHSPSDYLYVPLINGLGIFIGGIIALYIVFFRDKIQFIVPSVNKILQFFKEATPIFMSDIVISIKDRCNILFIGSFLGMSDVAIYDLATKIMGIFMQVISVANQSIYPYVARSKNMGFVKKFMVLSLSTTVLLIIIVQPFLKMVLDYLSNGLSSTLLLTEILLLSAIIMSISLPIARNCFLVLGLYKYLVTGSIYTTLFYLVLILIGFCLNLLYNVYTFALITVFVFTYEMLYRLYICRNKRILFY